MGGNPSRTRTVEGEPAVTLRILDGGRLVEEAALEAGVGFRDPLKMALIRERVKRRD